MQGTPRWRQFRRVSLALMLGVGMAGVAVAAIGSTRVAEAQASPAGAVVDAARADLASRTGTAPAQITLARSLAVRWSDGCLGVAAPGEACTEALVDGFALWFAVGNDAYRYHTGSTATGIRFAAGPLPLGGVAGAPVPAGGVAIAGSGTFAGGAPTAPGATLAVWSGGEVDDLRGAAPGATSFWVTVSGRFVGFIPAAPGFVNAEFLAAFPDRHIAAGTPMIAVLPLPGMTRIVHFTPERPAAETAVAGSCFTNSIAAGGRADAWRCITEDNELHDPCFALDAATIVCGANPATGAPGFLLTLSEPLPPVELSPAAVAAARVNGWLVRLADGTLCNFATGATGGVDGTRATYACADRRWLLGDLIPGSPWQADAATVSVGPEGWQADTRGAVSVDIVWQ